MEGKSAKAVKVASLFRKPNATADSRLGEPASYVCHGVTRRVPKRSPRGEMFYPACLGVEAAQSLAGESEANIYPLTLVVLDSGEGFNGPNALRVAPAYGICVPQNLFK